MAISCEVLGSNGTERVTIVSNITIEDKSNEIVLNGVVYKVESVKDISVNTYSTSNARGQFTGGKTVCTLVSSALNIALTFPGNKTGTFKWSQDAVVAGSVNKQGYGSLNPNGQSATGETVVTEYGDIGGLIKGTLHGVLWTQEGSNVYSVPVTGTFCVVHTQ